MKIPEKLREKTRMAWQGLTFVVGGLLLLDFCVCLVAAVAAVGWLFGQLELAVFTAVLLLLGILLFLPGKRLGVAKLPRRLLGAGLLGGGFILAFFCVMYAVMLFYAMQY